MPVEAQPSKTTALRDKPAQKAMVKVNPSAQEEDIPSTDLEAMTLFIIADALDKLICRHQMPENIKVKLCNLSRYASKMEVKKGKKEIVQISMEDIHDIHKDLLANLSGIYTTLENKISSVMTDQEQIFKATNSLTKKTEEINVAVKGIEDKVTKVNDTTAQITSTIKTYKDMLMVQPSHPPSTLVNLKLKDDLERKVKQILIIVHSNALNRKSLQKIQIKVEEMIVAMDNEIDHPEWVEIVAISITCSKALLLQLNSKQAADWLRDPLIKTKFTEKFAKDSFFIDRTYSIIMPRTPITFDPKREAHMWELEESNSLTPKMIRKAKWIKPINKRWVGQTHAYTILSLTSHP